MMIFSFVSVTTNYKTEKKNKNKDYKTREWWLRSNQRGKNYLQILRNWNYNLKESDNKEKNCRDYNNSQNIWD